MKGKNLDSHSEDCVPLASDPSSLSNHKLLDLYKSVHKLWGNDTDDVHQKVINVVTFNGQRYSAGLPWKAGYGPIP